MKNGRQYSLRILTTITIAVFVSSAGADDWPQWGGSNRDLVWRETGIVKTLPTTKLLPRVWSAPIREGYAGPAVADGRVFITDYNRGNGRNSTERVLCLNAETGKELQGAAGPG